MPCVSIRPARSLAGAIGGPPLAYWCRDQLLIDVRVNTMSGVTSRPQATARRKPAGERLAEIIEAAAAVGVAEGLDRVTAKRVAAELGVFPGLVSHYFATADELVATAFAHAAANEREQIFGHAALARRPVDRMRRLPHAWLHPDRDP